MEIAQAMMDVLVAILIRVVMDVHPLPLAKLVTTATPPAAMVVTLPAMKKQLLTPAAMVKFKLP